MTVSIGLIVWPEDRAVALRFYLAFLVKVLDELQVKFSGDSDPLQLTKNFLAGEVMDDERDASGSVWWDYLDAQNAVRDFQSYDALMARLAICLLCVKEKDVPEIGEDLSWFLEVLGLLKKDVNKVIKMMGEYFTFSPR